jgi:hypothetical protein
VCLKQGPPAQRTRRAPNVLARLRQLIQPAGLAQSTRKGKGVKISRFRCWLVEISERQPVNIYFLSAPTVPALPILDFPGTGHDPRLSQISASALCPGRRNSGSDVPARRALMESLHAAARCSAPLGAGNHRSAVLGSRAYRNHSTRLRDFPLPRGEGRCELVRKHAKRVKDRDRLTARSESSSRREEALHRFCFRGNLSLVTSAATGGGVFNRLLNMLVLSAGGGELRFFR